MIAQRAIELNLKPHQRFMFEVSRDILDLIIQNADRKGMKHMDLCDGSHTFLFTVGGVTKWSPRIFVIDSFKQGQFSIRLMDEPGDTTTPNSEQ